MIKSIIPSYKNKRNLVYQFYKVHLKIPHSNTHNFASRYLKHLKLLVESFVFLLLFHRYNFLSTISKFLFYPSD